MEATPTRPQSAHLSDEQREKFRHWLQAHFSDRCRKNPSYSLRSFARALALEPSTVSQFLSGKRAPSRKALLRITDSLGGSPKDLRLLGLAATTSPDEEFHQLTADSFAVMADWYHFAILELTFTKSFQSDPKWIARELAVPVTEVKSALERLLRLGLLEKKRSTLVKTTAGLTNHTGLRTSAARKNLQKQILQKALAAIDDTPQEEKDITSMTMAIDPKNLALAREMITKFRRELCLALEAGKQNRVYNLAIQLYPVSKGTEL